MVKPHNTSKGRVYTIDKVDFPSVTTVIGVVGGKNLISWAVNICCDYMEAELKSAKPYEIPHILDDTLTAARKRHNTIRDTAGSSGTSIHRVIEKRILGKDIPEQQLTNPDGTPTLASKVLDNFDIWLTEQEFEPLMVKDEKGYDTPTVEQRVWSKENEFAGTSDLIGSVKNGKIILADLKTGRSVHKTMRLQLAAYAFAFQEMHGILPDECLILHVLPSGHIREKLRMDREDMEKHYEIFLHLLKVYKWYT